MPDIRDNEINKQIINVTTATGIGVAGRALTWPLEYVNYQAFEKANTKPLLRLYYDLLSADKFCELTASFARTGFVQTILKSASNIGAMELVAHNLKGYSALEKGLATAGISATLETLVTSRGEYRKVQTFYQPKNVVNTNNFFSKSASKSNHFQINFSAIINKFFPNKLPAEMGQIFPPGFYRVVQANLFRNGFTSIITFVGLFQIEELLAPYYPESMQGTPAAKGCSAIIANVLIQPLNVPFLRFQAEVLKQSLQNPDKSFLESIKTFRHDNTISEMFRGTTARVIHRSIFYGTVLFASAYVKEHVAPKPIPISNNEVSPNPSIRR